jgi:hypothetical protein
MGDEQHGLHPDTPLKYEKRVKKIFVTVFLVFSYILLLSGQEPPGSIKETPTGQQPVQSVEKAPSGQDLGKSMKDDAENLWTMPPDKFMTAFASPKFYKWRSALKNNLIYTPDPQKTELFFMERPIIRGAFRFNANKLQGMYLTLAMLKTPSDHKTYLEKIEKLEKLIMEIGKFGKAKVVSHDSRNKHSCTHSWQSPEYFIALRFSYSQSPGKAFVPGEIVLSVFHRFSFDYFKAKTLPGKPEEKESQNTESQVKIEENGDHYLEVPMQKEKSPQDCVAASMRRIFAYYKTAPRDRKWKKINKTLALNEKSARGLKNIFGSIAGECRCEVKKIADVSVFDNFNNLKDFVKAYNRQAKKEKKTRLNSFTVTSFEKLLQVLDEDILVTVRNQPEKIAAFKNRVRKEINAGKPVLWIVFTGVVKEEPAVSTVGGRARLITGYNDKSNEVIYSDSLGGEHAKKKISWEKAWAMTLTALAVYPDN